MHIIVYGPEGSGKGTQAELISQKYNLSIYNSGNLVRQKAKEDNDSIGKICKNALTEGKYVNNETMYFLWEQYLSTDEAKKSFILDGFPRNAEQAKFLFEKVAKFGYKIDAVIFINLNDEVSYNRLINRNRKIFEGSNISHDTPERIKKRLSEYRKEEKEILVYFKKYSKLCLINGNQEREKVFLDIVKKLNNFLK